MIRLRRGMALNIGLGIAALAIYFAPIPKLAPSHNHDAPRLALATLPDGTTVDDMQALISRPVFSATRRPPAPTPAKTRNSSIAAKPAPTTNGLMLLGILHAGTRAVALVTLPGTLHPQQITLGAILEDWTVTKILADRIELASGTTHAELTLPQRTSQPAGTNSSPLNAPPPSQMFPQFPPLPSASHRSN